MERREETDAITNLSNRNTILYDAIRRARAQLGRGNVKRAKEILDEAKGIDRRMGNA